MTSISSTAGDLDRADLVGDEEFTDIEIAELQEEQPDGPSFTVLPEPPKPAPGAIAESAGPAAPVERPAVVAGTSAELAEAEAVARTLRSLGASVSALDSTDLAEHVDFYQQAHGQLQQALRDIDHA